MFEVKYAQTTDQLSICTPAAMAQGYSHVMSTCLPPPLPPKIQGWCTVSQTAQAGGFYHRQAGVRQGSFVKDMLIPNELVSSDPPQPPPPFYTTSQTSDATTAFNTKLAGVVITPPCASQLAIEFTFDELMMKWSWPADVQMPPKFRLSNKDGAIVSKTEPRISPRGKNVKDESGNAVTNMQYGACYSRWDYQVSGSQWCSIKHIRGTMVPANMALLRGSPYLMLETTTNGFNIWGGGSHSHWKLMVR